MIGLMDRLEIDRAHLVGNSMGGRVAIEMGLITPERVGALGLLCPAVAWVKRGFHPIVRLLRPSSDSCPTACAARWSRRSSSASSSMGWSTRRWAT